MNAGKISLTVIAAFFVSSPAANARESLWGYEFERTDAGAQIYYLDYSSPSERIEITAVSGLDGEIAEQMIAEKVFLFGSLFEKQRVGYPGQHTEYIECKPEFKPAYSEKSLDEGSLSYFKGFASDRFTFGACDEQSAVYSAVNAYVYCNDRKVMYDVSYFSLAQSDEDTQEFIGRIRCQP